MDAKDIATAVVEALESSRHLSRDEHDMHHTYIRNLLSKEKERAEIRKQVLVHMAKFGALGLVTFVMWAVWYYFEHLIGRH